MLDFDDEMYELGKLCDYKHNYENTGYSLRVYKKYRMCYML